MKYPVPVHILATCRNPELIRGTTLVFDTLRTGFPTADVTVWVNCVPDHKCGEALTQAMVRAEVDHFGYESRINSETPTTIHHTWIRDLLETQTAPFWILDTDVCFWDTMEDIAFDHHSLAGRYIPQFFDSFTNCITRPRLHTSLLYFAPEKIRKALEHFRGHFPETEFNPMMDLIYPVHTPVREKNKVHNYFYDTTSGLYNAIGGTPFPECILNRYDHLHFGTISDIVAPHYPRERFRETHFAIFENPELARGAWRRQEQWYADRAC